MLTGLVKIGGTHHIKKSEWAENGGEGHVHLLCPKWDKKEQ